LTREKIKSGKEQSIMAAEALTNALLDNIVSLGTKNGIEMAILRRSAKTLGKVIFKPDSPDLIDDVQIEPLAVQPDDRGFFMEVGRLGKGLSAKMTPEGARQIQISFTLTYPGTIKAIHYHSEQTDLWTPVSGMLQVFLYDLRRHSKTFGAINTIYAGSFRPWQILIPPGVGHGYKALGVEPVQLIYFTDRHYNPADELRIAYNDSNIAYDWEIQHK
jgi:dTDP-4-dehydrorhamnose 3,5-epimerase